MTTFREWLNKHAVQYWTTGEYRHQRWGQYLYNNVPDHVDVRNNILPEEDPFHLDNNVPRFLVLLERIW